MRTPKNTAVKIILLGLLIGSTPIGIRAQKTDTVLFYYVLQNPKFYGTDKAKSWFEIRGLTDKAVETKINKTLLSAYNELTLLDTSGAHEAMGAEETTPPGYMDYSFYNDATYGYGWIRFKVTDSLLYLTNADGYYGSGTSLGSFQTEIAQGKLAWIQIFPSAYGRRENLFQTINLGFHLKTGDTIRTVYTLRLEPTKRDTLEKLLDQKVLEVANKTIYHDRKILSRHHLSDTVSIPLQNYIQWLNGNPDRHATIICREFEVEGHFFDIQKMTGSCAACIPLSESLPFLNQTEWNKLQKYYR